jgi:hypothetical protein
MRIGLLIIILLLWLVEADVFQLPQLHKHLIVGCHTSVLFNYTKDIMKLTTFILGLYAFTNSTFGQDTTYNLVTQQLLKIDELDQRYRNQIDFVETKYGRESKELQVLFKDMRIADSTNLIQVESIIKKYGWLGYDKIGSQANTALFMVIQHSDQLTQEKYLPLMREAVKNGKAKAKSLALLEDRIALHRGKMQSYGSQIFWSKVNNRYVVLPLNDPDNVDKRRAEVGLQPLLEYVSVWNIQWNVEKYKKELPLILAEWKKMLH